MVKLVTSFPVELLLAHVHRGTHHTARAGVAAALVSLHVAAHAESLAAPGMGALERLLAGMRVAVDLQTGRPGECFVARWANVAFLRLRESRVCRWTDVVVVLPGVCSGNHGC